MRIDRRHRDQYGRRGKVLTDVNIRLCTGFNKIGLELVGKAFAVLCSDLSAIGWT